MSQINTLEVWLEIIPKETKYDPGKRTYNVHCKFLVLFDGYLTDSRRYPPKIGREWVMLERFQETFRIEINLLAALAVTSMGKNID